MQKAPGSERTGSADTVLTVSGGTAGTVQQIFGSVSQSGSTTGNGKDSTLVGARYPAGLGSICGILLGIKVCGVAKRVVADPLPPD